MPNPASGVRSFPRAMLVVKLKGGTTSREILINDLNWDIKNTASVEKTEGAVGVEDDTGPADMTASWTVKDANGGLDYYYSVVTPGQRDTEISIRTAKGTAEAFGVLNGVGGKQPGGPGHTETISFAGVVTAWVKSS